MILSLNVGFPNMDSMTLGKLLFSKPKCFHLQNYYRTHYVLLCQDQIREAKLQYLEQRLNLSEKFGISILGFDFLTFYHIRTVLGKKQHFLHPTTRLICFQEPQLTAPYQVSLTLMGRENSNGSGKTEKQCQECFQNNLQELC